MDIEREKPRLKFAEHIRPETNSRIVLTGKFGTGKSYFLKKYFESCKNQYTVFWISPVNYVVGINQDIFEWIKVDIARELVIEHFTSQKTKISRNFLIQSYLYGQAPALFAKLIQVIADEAVKLKTGVSFLSKFKKEVEEYNKFETEAKNQIKSEFENLNNFLNFSFNIRGSIYEDDITTQTIRASLEIIKKKSKNISVLVIDDLDRLDPEHIFRILNILSTHNDHFDSNKFGFNKVILVCDLENIEKLYRYRYGPEADFEGYIEKFFSYEPFEFSIKDAIVNFCKNNFSLSDLSDATKNIISLLLVCLYNHDKLRIRNLKKIVDGESISVDKKEIMRGFQISFSDPNIHLDIRSTFFKSSYFEIDFSTFDFIKGLILISMAFGGIKKLKQALIDILEFESLNEIIDEKYLPHIFKSICILSHIARTLYNNPRDIFFNWRMVGGDDHFKVVEAQNPVVNFLGRKFQLQLIWSREKPYDKGDFFLEANTLVGLRETKNGIPNFRNLIDEIIVVIEMISKEGLV